MKKIKKLLENIFGYSSHNNEERQRKSILIMLVGLTAFSGLIYSFIYVMLGVHQAITAILLYIGFSTLNLIFYFFNKNHNLFRNIQLVAILLFPTLTHALNGGFEQSSVVVLAAMLSPLGALMFHSSKAAKVFFYLFILMLLLSTILDLTIPIPKTNIPKGIRMLFYFFNIAAISSISFFLLLKFVSDNEEYKKLLKLKNLELSEEKKLVVKTLNEISEQNEEIQSMNTSLNYQKEQIEERNTELHAQNEEISSQRDQLSKQNKSISESILYAKRIQSAVLPPAAYIDELLPENFILFKPRDEVSGDFYWIKQMNEYIVIAIADCTGHGVPGAIMSMLGISSLNEIIQKEEITQAKQILNELRKKIKQALRQTGKKGETDDGMDMALCTLDAKTRKLNYAGANNSLYLIQNGELSEIKADRMPIGYYPNEKPSFSNHQIQLKEGDTFYMASDGFSDQFGGEKGFKYKASNFQKILLENHQKPMVIQKELLEQELTNWMKGYEQTDDILVMGVRV